MPVDIDLPKLLRTEDNAVDFGNESRGGRRLPGFAGLLVPKLELGNQLSRLNVTGDKTALRTEGRLLRGTFMLVLAPVKSPPGFCPTSF
jgi:hypothetical protein